jgi:ribosome-binding factor A
MESTRQQKMARLLQKELGEILEQEMRGTFHSALITVTKVNVSKDLSIARYYMSVFAVKDKKATMESIKAHTSEFRYRLGKRIGKQVRIIPHLEFFEDDSLDYIENLEKLL